METQFKNRKEAIRREKELWEEMEVTGDHDEAPQWVEIDNIHDHEREVLEFEEENEQCFYCGEKFYWDDTGRGLEMFVNCSC